MFGVSVPLSSHDGVQCDTCQMFPIVGVRYKCGNCVDYDLCSNCEPNSTHDSTHLLLKIKNPLPDVNADMDTCLLKKNMYAQPVTTLPINAPIGPTRSACSRAPPRKSCKMKAPSDRPSSIGKPILSKLPSNSEPLPEIDVNLMSAAVEVLLLQERISKIPDFFTEVNVTMNLQKYVQFLHVVANNASTDLLLVPTDEIEIIWQSHLMRPEDYRRDCMTLFNKVIPHSIVTDPLLKNIGIQNYNNCDNKSCDLNELNVSLTVEEIIKDSKWFGYYKSYCGDMTVSYYDDLYLGLSLNGYKQFIQICKDNIDSDVLEPTYAIDLFWHTHMFYPLQYNDYTEGVLGELLVHEPWPKRFTDAQMFDNLVEMDKIWEQKFNSSIHNIRDQFLQCQGTCS